MTKIVALVALILAALTTQSAHACRDMTPDLAALESYGRIFVGEISGIRLIEYENRRLSRPSGCKSDQDDDEIPCIDHIAGSPRIKLFVIPTKVIKGIATDVQELEQAGCTNSDIPLMGEGIFFVYPNSTTAVIVWRFKTPDYASWLAQLGVSP